MNRVVVTGWGWTIPGPIPHGLEAFWAICQGTPMITAISDDPTWSLATPKVAALVLDNNSKSWFQEHAPKWNKDSKDIDPFVLHALKATDDAIRSSNLSELHDWRNNASCIIGSGVGGMSTWQEQTLKRCRSIYTSKSAVDFSPNFVPMVMPNSAAGWACMLNDLHGNSFSPNSACATGAHAIQCLYNSIRLGDTSIGIAGGTESTVSEYARNTFYKARALAHGYPDNLLPHQISRPYNACRYGFVMGEGAGIVILEELEHALVRNAPIWGEIMSVGTSTDTAGITKLGPFVQVAMERAIEQAGIQPQQIDYFNAHATSTLGDSIELAAIANSLKTSSRVEPLPVSSTKSVTGHMMGAAGAVELIICLLAMRYNFIPATYNLDEIDPECTHKGIELVANQSIDCIVNIAMTNSSGFGGHNVSTIVKKYQPRQGLFLEIFQLSDRIYLCHKI